MARVNKFNPINLNDLYGKKEPSVKPAATSSSSAIRPKLAGHGGMLVLSRPVKQQPKLANLGSLKKEGTDSSAAPPTSNTSWTNTPQVEGTKKENATEKFEVNDTKAEAGNLTTRRDVYVPPGIRSSNSVSVQPPPVSSNVAPSVQQKSALLRGEEFPTLQDAVAPSSNNGPQRGKDAHQKSRDKEPVENQLRGVSLQGNSESFDGNVDRFQPLRPRYESVKSNAILGKPDSSLPYYSTNEHRSEWADDERADGFNPKPAFVTNDRTESGYNRYGGETVPRPRSADKRYGNETTARPRSGEAKYRRDAVARPASGGRTYDYERIESIDRPVSREGRYEREIIPQPGGDSVDYEGEAGMYPYRTRPEREVTYRPGSRGAGFLRPGSGGMCDGNERDSVPRPPSGGGYHMRPGSGGSIRERDASQRPNSGGRYDKSRNYSNQPYLVNNNEYGRPYEREVFHRPGSGDGYSTGVYSNNYEREVFHRPGTGDRYNNREATPVQNSSGGYAYSGPTRGGYEREVISRPGSGGRDYMQQNQGSDNRMTCPGSGGPRPDARQNMPYDDRYDRAFGPDVPNRKQGYQARYDSTRERGAFKDSWFKPGGAPREGRGDYGRRPGSSDGHGRDVSHDYVGSPEGRFGRQGYDGYSRIPEDDKHGVQRYREPSREELKQMRSHEELYYAEDHLTKEEAEEKRQLREMHNTSDRGILAHREFPSGREKNPIGRPRQVTAPHANNSADYFPGRSMKPTSRSELASSWRRDLPSADARDQLQHVDTVSRNFPTGSANTDNYQLF